MLIAFASSDGFTIDSHFGTATMFELYKFTPQPQGIIHTSLAARDLNESVDKVNARIDMLKECAIVYCTQIGGPAAAKLVQSGIHPLKVPEGTLIVDELNRMNKLMLSKKLPPWLRMKMEAVEGSQEPQKEDVK